MDFELSPAQKAIQQTAREFAQKEVKPTAIQSDAEESFPRETYRRMGELGMLAAIVPTKYGGGGLDHLSTILPMEEVGYYNMALAGAMNLPAFNVGKPLLYFASEEQKLKYMPKMCTGEYLIGMAATEPQGGTDLSTMTTRAEAKGNKYVIVGKKVWISCLNAEYILTVARQDKVKPPYTAFLIKRDQKGMFISKYHHKLGYRPDQVGELAFDDCEVSAEQRVGEEGQGLKVILSAVEEGRLGVGARACGAIRACLDEAVKHAKERVVFGNPIGRYQLTQAKIADMVINLECARLITYQLACLKDRGVARARKESSMVKRFTTDSMAKAAADTIQILGSQGCSNEHLIAVMFRDAKIHQILEGTNDLHTVLIGEITLGYRKA
ncbi:MAG: acyl-CoA dehydrogenase family protein [Chloroflexota bacterium]